MKEVVSQISEVAELFSQHSSEEVFRKLAEKHRVQHLYYSQQTKSMNTELTQLLRCNDQAESEAVHLRHTKKRLEDSLSSMARTRLPQAKNLVRLEEELFAVEDEIQRKKAQVEEKEEILRVGFKPSVDSLFLELVKGFGIDFIDKGGMRVLIKDRKKNDVVSIDIDNDAGKWEVSNKVWSNL